MISNVFLQSDPASLVSNEIWMQWAAGLQILFVFVAALDAGWFHFFKYRLHTRQISRREHFLHTSNALLFPFTIIGVFVMDARGLWLWAVLLCYFVTFTIEIVDVWEEKRSRAVDGGLEPLESVLHFAMGLLRAAVLGIFLASRPVDAFRFGTEHLTILKTEIFNSSFWQSEADWVVVMGWMMVAASLPMAVLHVVTYYFGPKSSFFLKQFKFLGSR